MAANLERLEKSICDFVVDKCQLLPKSYDAVSEPIHVVNEYYMICGSTMEFYIRPLNSGINDMDVLVIKCDHLAFQGDFPVFANYDVSRLHDTIECYRIESHLTFPGFVRLRFGGKLNYSWKYKTYEFSQTTDNTYIKINMPGNVAARQLTDERLGAHAYVVRGPAFTMQNSAIRAPSDSVSGAWCPTWPVEAKGWPRRHRNHGWPTVNTIIEIVQHGCHVVHVQHRACRNDVLQWRLSFSVAEVILLQSWTKIQQIVYHMLRFFASKELIKKNCPKEDEVLCTYHLKTLMLWTCEEKTPEWWNRASVITICCELLEKLSEWLRRGYCPNYFIPEANLFHEPFKSPMFNDVEWKLKTFCRFDILCQWFFGNYVVPIILANFKVEQKMDITQCLQTLTEDRKTLQSKSLNLLFLAEFVYCNVFTRMSINSKTIHPRSILSKLSLSRKFKLLGDRRMAILPMPVDVSCFTYFDKTVFCLNTAYSLAFGEISSDGAVFEYVRGIFLKNKIVRCRYHIFPEPLTAGKSQCQFLRAQHLMENLTGADSTSELQLLSLMSKAFLRKALECDDNHSSVIAPAALTYLAALHFARSEYQIAIDLQATHFENETLNAGCLLFIDDVARILGLSLLYRKFNKKMLFTGRQIYLDLRLSVKVFACYLAVASAGRIFKQFELNNGLPTSAFPFDHCLMAFIKQKPDILATSCICLKADSDYVHFRTDFVTKNASLDADRLIRSDKVIDSLNEIALENLMSFYSRMCRDFNIQCNTIDCYRALYLYKCRRYDEVVHLCERILHEPDLDSDLKEFAFANVLVMTPFDSFFDSDVQSLVALHTLLHFLSPQNDDLSKFKLAAQLFDQGAHLDYLLKHYFVTSDYFLGKHFLARYLRLRCHIDCNYPFKKELSEVYAMKISFPFEQIIRLFLQQRHRQIHYTP